MQISSHTFTTADGFAEIGTVTHNGRDYSAAGAAVSDQFAAGYIKGNTLTTWDGLVIGTARIVAGWRTPNSYLSSHMYQIEVTLHDGRKFTGRGAGCGMLWRGKRQRVCTAKQSRALLSSLKSAYQSLKSNAHRHQIKQELTNV